MSPSKVIPVTAEPESLLPVMVISPALFVRLPSARSVITFRSLETVLLMAIPFADTIGIQISTPLGWDREFRLSALIVIPPLVLVRLPL